MSDQAFKRILVYVTTRHDEHAALNRAAALARHSGAKVTLLAVAEELSLLLQRSVEGHSELVDELKAETNSHLKQLAAPLIAEGLKVTCRVRYGRPHIEIIRAVQSSKFDLVVKTAESRALAPLLGSTAMKLLRLCPAAVWVEKPARRRSIRRIVATVDPFAEHEEGRQLNHRIVETASIVAALEGAELTVLHAWHAFGIGILRGRGGLSRRELTRYRKSARQKASEEFEKFQESVSVRVTKKQMRLIEGEPAHVIPEFTRTNRTDLIVMGSVARTGVAGMLIGNTAEQILSRVRCSVLAVKPDAFVSPVKTR